MVFRVPESRHWDIVGVGDIDVDVFLGVQQLAGPDDKVLGRLFGEHPGGMIANVCCAASQLGAATAMIGRVGTDPYARIALTGLKEHGVDTSLVRVVPSGRTFFCVIMLDGTGEKALTAVDTDCHLPRRGDVDVDALAKTRLVHVMGDDLEFACWIADEANKRGTRVSLDLEASTAAHGLAALRPLLKNTDVLFMNSRGCRDAFGGATLTAARRALELGPQVVAITLGAQGAIVADEDTALHVGALHRPVVDTTGAGDCFIGAFLTQLLDGQDLPSCARYATASASYVIGAVGSRSSLPTHDMALNRLDQTVIRPVEAGES
jgi:ribokinase